jgi:hypothetical protein
MIDLSPQARWAARAALGVRHADLAEHMQAVIAERGFGGCACAATACQSVESVGPGRPAHRKLAAELAALHSLSPLRDF